MLRKPAFLMCLVVQMAFVGGVYAQCSCTPGQTVTITGAETCAAPMSIACHYIIQSTGSVTGADGSTLNGSNATIEVNGGSFHCTGRFNLGQGGDGYIYMNGGTFTVDGTWKFPDDDGGVHRMWINGGIVHSGDIEFRGDRDGIIYVGAGILRVTTVGTDYYDPANWVAQGWLQPAEGYDQIIIENKGSYTEITAVILYCRVQFAAEASSAPESVSPAALMVTLSNAEPGQTYTVDYAATGGTATGGGVDYTLAPGTLTFLPGQTSRTISFGITNDGLPENDETVIVELSNPGGAGLLLGQTKMHTYIILDSRPGVGFEAAASSGLENVTTVNIPVSLSATLGATATVNYAVTGGTAASGADYTLLGSGTLQFSPGVTTQYVPLSIVDDTFKEIPDETIELTLSNPSANVKLTAAVQHTYTIINDDQGVWWNGLTWFYSNYSRGPYVNEQGQLEWFPEKGGQYVTRLPDMPLSQVGQKVQLTYFYMSDGKDDCPPDSCYNCIYCDDDITCIAGTSDFRFGLFQADGEYITADGFDTSSSIFAGYKGYNWRFGPHLQAYPTRWVDCTGEVHKTGNFAKKPQSSSNLMTINEGLEDYIPGFELPPGEWSLLTISLERLSSSSVKMLITLNDTTYTWTDASSSEQPTKIDVFGVHMRNGRPYYRLVLDTLWPQPASNPSPMDGAENVDPGVVLDWQAGGYVVSHDVYLGTNFDDVNDADTSSSVYKGRQDLEVTTYDPPEPLEGGRTYCWRIDEINRDDREKGAVWSFTVQGFIGVDDMEDYDEYTLYDTWVDGVENGTGSWIMLVSAPACLVHGGVKSIWFDYNNNFEGYAKYSEIYRKFADPCDWTAPGTKILTLYFYGDPGNDASQQLYAGLEDGRGAASYAGVKYGDMNDVTEAE
ncbi:MAG TPA: Calx-beta domain-containing protein, partial [Sedimentisphaerales bacterium]|nr:Calx-beta domain-containing protein [Sedimentisphaerales bacterium]